MKLLLPSSPLNVSPIAGSPSRGPTDGHGALAIAPDDVPLAPTLAPRRRFISSRRA